MTNALPCASCSTDLLGLMELVALGLLVFGIALAEPVSRRLARARWPARDPVGALLLWQAIGLSGGLALVGSGLVYGLSPLGPTLPAALPHAFAALESWRWPDDFGIGQALALLAALLLVL